MRDPQSPLPKAKAVRECYPQVLSRYIAQGLEIFLQPSVRQLQGRHKREISRFGVSAVYVVRLGFLDGRGSDAEKRLFCTGEEVWELPSSSKPKFDSKSSK
jgi:hypothetical protein